MFTLWLRYLPSSLRRHEQVPALQALLIVVQSTQQPLWAPQFEFEVPGWQLPA
jgi:hypothetical protein